MKRIVIPFLFLLSFFNVNRLPAQSLGKEYKLGASTIWQVIKTTSDGNLITVGDYTAGETSPNIILITKLKPDGSVMWSKTYGGDIQQNGLNITETTDGSFVIAGIEFVYDFNANEFLAKGCIIKLSKEGDKLWSHYLQYGNQNYFVLSHVTATPDGSVIAGGSFQQFAGGTVGSYAYVAKIDAAGAITWAKQFDTKGYRRWIAGVSCTGQVITVVSESAIGNGNNAEDAAAITLMKEEDGSVITSKRYRLSGSGIHFIQTASAAADGSVIVSGTTGNGIGDFDIWTFKVNSKLNIQWSNVISQGGDDRPNQVVSGENGITIIGAVSSDPDNFFNPYLIWLDSNGNAVKNQLLPQLSRGVFGIASLGDTTYALVNQQFGTGSNPYTNIYAWQGTAGVCASAVQAGNWQQAPDVITDNRKTPVTEVNTIVSEMNYAVADVSLTVDNVCSVLPLQFLSFTGAYTNGGVLLNWKTASEINTQLFTVEKSLDGGSHYTAAGTVAAQGNGSHSYTFTDKALMGGTLLYRIKTTDKDGRISYSNSVAITVPVAKKVIVYPNPAGNKITVSLLLPKAVALQMRILTVTGQTVQQQILTGSAGVVSQAIDVSRLPAGIYVIHITGEDVNETLRFEKE